MARRVVTCAPGVVRAMFANAVLDSDPVEASVGGVRLHEHQRQAIARARESLRQHGGALLADAVGLGKTFVALAVATGYDSPLVIAPAVLRPMWLEAAGRAHVQIAFASTESLSRRQPAAGHDLVIVDEAHHFRTERTKRHARLARVTATAPVLLLSATPIHNRRRELAALLGLFLGERVKRSSAAELSSFLIRREHGDVEALALPSLLPLRRIEIPAEPAIAREIRALPSPLPPRNGTPAAALIRLGLAGMWASSDAALLTGIRRRLALAGAMRDSLTAGRLPSRQELATWCGDDTSTQLAFVELVIDAPAPEIGDALTRVEEHLAALRRLRELVNALPSRDPARVSHLQQLRTVHRNERIVVFSGYAETVRAVFRSLVATGRVAAVTSRGGRIASGAVPCADVLAMFREPGHARERIDLLLTTDLLSEGVNLPEATVIVHLDLPWTAARMEQRTGRLRRPGGSGRSIVSYAFTEPAAIKRLISREALLRHKARVASEAVGSLALFDEAHRGRQSPARATEMVRRIARRWAIDSPAPDLLDGWQRCIRVSAVAADARGFAALLRRGTAFHMIAGQADDSTGAASFDPRKVHAILSRADGRAAPVTHHSYRAARLAIEHLLRSHHLQQSVGAASTAVAGLLAQLGAAVAASPPHQRPEIAPRVSAVRQALATRLTAGLERELQILARSNLPPIVLLERCERLLTARPRPVRSGTEYVLLAVLLLELREANAAAQLPRSSATNDNSRSRWSYPLG